MGDFLTILSIYFLQLLKKKKTEHTGLYSISLSPRNSILDQNVKLSLGQLASLSISIRICIRAGLLRLCVSFMPSAPFVASVA